MKAEAYLNFNDTLFLEIYMENEKEGIILWGGTKYSNEELKNVKAILEKETGKKWTEISRVELLGKRMLYVFKEVTEDC